MDRRTLLAMLLCTLIFFGWQKFFIEPRMQATAPTAVSTSSTAPTQQAQEPSSKEGRSNTNHLSSAKTRKPPQTLPISMGTGEAILSDSGAFFSGWNLKNYKLGISAEAPAVNLQSVTHKEQQVQLAFDDPNLSYLNEVQGNLKKTAEGAIWTYEDSQVKMTREYLTNEQQPYFDIQIKTEFKNKSPKYAFVLLGSKAQEKDPEAQDRQFVYWTNQSIQHVPLKDTIDQKEISSPVKYVGATNRYFVMALIAQAPLAPTGLIQPTGPYEGRASLVYPMTGNTLNIPLRVYFGPKDLEILRQVEPTLDHTVDFGWFTFFAYPLLKLLKWFYQFVHNYGVAIILLTLLLKILTYPLTYKSMKSMKKMAKLQPQLQKLRDKYKDDREALNREMLVMMRSQGYNPMAGCLPIIIQMPIFFALYRVLYSSIELYHAPFAGWIQDLSIHDPFYVTPILLSITMFVQQKLTPNTATDPAQARMMQLMPLIFGAFMLSLPSGLTIYMLVNAIASIAQQMILNKKFDTAGAK